MERFIYYSKPEVESPDFLKLPKTLIYGRRYSSLISSAKLAYVVLRDRLEWSVRNGCYDENGNVFCIYTNVDLAETLRITATGTVAAIKQSLSDVGLLYQVRVGQNMPNHLYIGQPVDHFNDVATIENKLKSNATEFMPLDDSARGWIQ